MASKENAVWVGGMDGTPLGEVWAAVSARGLVAVGFPASRETITRELQRMGFQQIIHDQSKVQPALSQIDEYLHGQRRVFDLPIDWSVITPFQQQALQVTAAIPYGQTATYREIAIMINRPRAARAVGRAQATNPMPLVIPCHRVLGTDGGLHGYGAGEGLATKAWLLRMEIANAGK